MWAGKCTSYDNTGDDHRDQPDGQQDRHGVCREGPDGHEVAAGTLDRTYFWKIDKSVDDTLIEIAAGGTTTFHYSVKVTPDGLHGQRVDAERHDHGEQPERLGGHHGGRDGQAPAGGVCTVTGGDDVVIPAGQVGDVELQLHLRDEAGRTKGQEAPQRPPGTRALYFTPAGTASLANGRCHPRRVAGETNRTITVVDDKTDPAESGDLGHERLLCGAGKRSSTRWTSRAWAGTCTDYTNTAVIKETKQSDSQTVTVCVGKDLTITKTAVPTLSQPRGTGRSPRTSTPDLQPVCWRQRHAWLQGHGDPDPHRQRMEGGWRHHDQQPE